MLRKGWVGTIRRIPESNSRGFSVIEMAIVMLVIAIAAAFLIPRAIDYMRAYRLGVAARNLATAIQRARYLATSSNTRAGISIPQANRIEIEVYDLENNTKTETKGTIDLPEGILITTPAPIQIAFDGRGVVTPMPKENQVIRIDGTGNYFATVTISLTGQITVSDAQQES